MDRLTKDLRKCLKKKRYDHINNARGTAKHILKRDGKQLYPYECKNCGMYHLTRKKLKEGARL